MRLSLFLLLGSLVLPAAQAQTAPRKLLQCNFSGVDTQAATVVQNGESLVLQELTAAGRPISRPLTKAEWESGTIKIYAKSGTASLSRVSRDWWFEFKEDSFTYMGYADCRGR